MSASARRSVWDHSPYKGSALIVHLALGDVANDMNDNELWASIDRIAKKCRLGRSAVSAALAKMVGDGYLEILTEGGGRGKATRYRFLFPETGGSVDGLGGRQPRDPGPETARSATETARSVEPSPHTNRREPKRTEPRGSEEEPRATLDGIEPPAKSQRSSDPLVAEAHEITTRIFANRETKPLPKFLNVRGLAVRALRSGWTGREVERVMMQPTAVFTLAGLEAGRAKLAPNGNARGEEKLDMIAAHFGLERKP